MFNSCSYFRYSCVNIQYFRTFKFSFLAQIGDHNITANAMEPEQTWAGVEQIIEHFAYDGDVLNDIAVLRLAQEVSKS